MSNPADLGASPGLSGLSGLSGMAGLTRLIGGGDAGAGFGVPGVYYAPDEPVRTLTAEPMDVCAFVGVAPRGPAYEPVDDPTLVELGVPYARSVPVAVESWDEYLEHFGSFEAPGLLPHAVAAFFAQGGRRAVVVRIVHRDLPFVDGAFAPPGCARHDLVVGTQTIAFRARNEGTWGDRLHLTLSFTTRPLALATSEAAALVLDPAAVLDQGALVRLHDAAGVTELRWVASVRPRGRVDSPIRDLVATLDQPIGFAVTRAEQVDGVLDVVDLDPTHGRREHHAALGLQPGHPRWLADVVRADSRLVDLVASAPPGPIAPTDLALPPSTSAPAKNPDGTEKADNGADRWDLITPDDLFGSLLLGDDTGTEGLDALLAAPEVASIVVPDLYSAVDLPSNEPVELDGLFAGPTFAPCLVHPTRTAPPPPSRPLTGLHLDPTRPADLNTIITLQLEVTRVAERLRAVALLDVPPGLRQRAIVRWRSNFDSSHAAAYHPWLRTPLDPAGGRGALIAVNPAAIAAGAIARSELVAGVPRGPANLVAVGIVDVVDRLDDVRHAELHQAGIDVFRLEADGVRLTGARTLSNDRAWRQLSVRRLLLLIERSVEHQLQWTVFEPNDAGLRAGLRRMLDHLLDRLFAQGAFAGATPAQSWFVRVSAGPDLALEADRGQVVVEVGVAPSEPTEFIIVRVSLDADGAIETSLRAAGTPAAPVGVGAHG